MPVVWRLIDGKPGHERQTAGFVKALNKISPCDIYDIDAQALSAMRALVLPRNPSLPTPRPDLIIGAGRLCEIAMLVLKRRFGGRTIYFMRPRLPTRLFDLCVIPHHDGPADQPHIIGSEGVLNDLHPASSKIANTGVILIGGPSKHHQWDEEHLLGQLNELIAHRKNIHFKLTPSRRTPESTKDKLKRLGDTDYYDPDSIDLDWLPRTLAESTIAWVTKDSVSMIYEALSCGAKVGLLDVPVKHHDRITRVPETLINRAFVTEFSEWQRDRQMQDSPTLAEADRIARRVDELLLTNIENTP